MAAQQAPPELNLYITDTLGNPFVEEEQLPQIVEAIAKSDARRTGSSAISRSPSSSATRHLLNLLNVLGRLVALEPRQADLLDRIVAGPLVAVDAGPAQESGTTGDGPSL
jgi:hypothetical protein